MDPQGVLRSGPWLKLRTLVWMAALVAATYLITAGWQVGVMGLVRHQPRLLQMLAIAPAILLAYLAYAAAVVRFERRNPVELAPSLIPRDLSLGLLIGLVLMTLICVGLSVTKAYIIAPGGRIDLAPEIVAKLLTALEEELIFRAIIFRLLMRAFGVWPALVASAVIFGGVHLANPHATLTAGAAIAIEAGLMLAAFYLVTGRIWMSVGVHAAWNFTQGPIFGAPISGRVGSGGLWISTPRPRVSDLFSGGAFGPEASLIAALVGSAVFLVLVVLMYRNRATRMLGPPKLDRLTS